jgi:hypothetical protein
MRELLILAVLAALAGIGALAMAGTEALLRLATVHPITLRYQGSHLMKSAIATPDADTDIVPATTTDATAELVPAKDYPAWLDEFDHQIQALVQLARAGNRIAYNIVIDLQAKHANSSDQANAVAAILERPGRGGS